MFGYKMAKSYNFNTDILADWLIETRKTRYPHSYNDEGSLAQLREAMNGANPQYQIAQPTLSSWLRKKKSARPEAISAISLEIIASYRAALEPGEGWDVAKVAKWLEVVNFYNEPLETPYMRLESRLKDAEVKLQGALDRISVLEKYGAGDPDDLLAPAPLVNEVLRAALRTYGIAWDTRKGNAAIKKAAQEVSCFSDEVVGVILAGKPMDFLYLKAIAELFEHVTGKSADQDGEPWSQESIANIILAEVTEVVEL